MFRGHIGQVTATTAVLNLAVTMALRISSEFASGHFFLNLHMAARLKMIDYSIEEMECL